MNSIPKRTYGHTIPTGDVCHVHVAARGINLNLRAVTIVQLF